MLANKLRKSILQMAVQGKLVPQDPADEPASALLQKIRKEREKLVQQGKIKKPKAESFIFRRDGSWWERSGKEEKCIDDEIPFEIPDSWEWVRLTTICKLQAGKFISSQNITDNYMEGLFPCYGGNGIRGYVDRYNWEGDYPLIGRQGALCGNINFASGKFYATEHAVVANPYVGIDVNWFKEQLIALNLNQYATATAQPGLAVSKIEQTLTPLPPLAEQKRIAAKIAQFMAVSDNLAKALVKA